MWGTTLRQRLRLLPLFGALSLADRLAPLVPARSPRAHGRWQPGISVVIPDRDAPVMLMEALGSLRGALAAIDEPSQVVVVANGATADVYAGVRSHFPEVEWVHDDQPLGFTAAIERGLREVRYDGVYLMNNDVTLDARAIAELLPHREPDVFAISSQILQRGETGRREETGFTDWMIDGRGLGLLHARPRDARAAVPHLCASGGASLFRTVLLRQYLPASHAYAPFYWEDAEWAVRAWRDGYRVLFCPASMANHRHRASTRRFYPEDEVERVVERNRTLFGLRHGVDRASRARLMEQVCDLPYRSQRELSRLSVAVGVLRNRVARERPPQPSAPPVLLPDADGVTRIASASYSYRMRPTESRVRPRLLVVTPFCVFPPRHGGGRRVAELVRGLRQDFDIALVTDESTLYDARSFFDFDDLCKVRLVQRPPEAESEVSLPARMRTHCHRALVAAVQEICRDFGPDLVQIEHAELAPLVAHRQGKTPWVLDLHDAYASVDLPDPASAAAFASQLERYDAIVVCSDEDRRMVRHPRVACVPNGAAAPEVPYQPSASSRLLFVGPFRYEPNYAGIVEFLRSAWPAIRAAVPEATLLVLGGDEHRARTATEPAFAQPGVDVLGHREDVQALLAGSAVSINPLSAIRGSAIKVAESLMAGRVCVSTHDGARGFLVDPPAGLVTVADVASMARAVIDLLIDVDTRHRREAPTPDVLVRYGWGNSVRLQAGLYRTLLANAVEKAGA
jgi:GT2 family glycosyltransferase/glycosyltransferase involved in cell wall biosynthesis